jgi:Tfp pilus assembly protein PilX
MFHFMSAQSRPISEWKFMKISHNSQEGVALPVATGMLMVISILAVGFFTVAIQVNTTSVGDRSSKRALAAAEAGLQTAVYRLNLLNQSAPANAANCLTTTWVVPATGGECPAHTESLGNGAQYSYHVTPATTAGSAGCVTLPGVPTSATDRCITSIGIVNGVRRRVQTRVVSQPVIPPFNQVGLIGKSLVFAYNSANLNSDVGSNLRVVFENSVNVYDNDSINVDGKVMLLQGGTYDYENSVKIDGGTQTITTPFVLNTPNFETIETTNDNGTLASDLGTAWNSTTRRINLESGERTIRPGTYHVCGVTLGNSVKLKFSHTGGALTQIWVDSPSRPGSDFCAGQADPAGTFTADNSVEVNKEVGEREELLDIYMYGTPYNDTRPMYPTCEPIHHPNQTATCRSDFMLDNSVNFYGSVYAPNSTIQAHNSVKFYGATAADKIIFFNSVDFFLTGEVKDRTIGGLGAAQRRGWAECRPQPAVAADPESGC